MYASAMTENQQIKIQFLFTCIYLSCLDKFHIHILSSGGIWWCFGMVKKIKTHTNKNVSKFTMVILLPIQTSNNSLQRVNPLNKQKNIHFDRIKFDPAQKQWVPLKRDPWFFRNHPKPNRLENPTSQPSKHHSRCIGSIDRSPPCLPWLVHGGIDLLWPTVVPEQEEPRDQPFGAIWKPPFLMAKKTGSFFFGGTWLGHERSYPCDIQFQITPHLGSENGPSFFGDH